MSKRVSEETDSVVKRRPQSEPALEKTVSLEVLSAWPIKCAYAVQEIYKTEADYVQALEDILQGYRTPLSYHLKSDNEGHKVISTLFSNVNDLYNLHQGLLKELKRHEGDPHGFGNVFVVSEAKFRQYCVYCTNYDAAIACLQTLLQDQDFTVFVLSCQHNLGHMLPLSSQLIKPVQRIMRYHIMLKEVIKHFDRNHHGYQSLCKAHATMLRSGDYINENKKQKENAERVQDLQSNTTGWTSKDVRNLSAYGELIIEDSCKVGNRGIERQVVLFEKLLVILKKKDTKKYTYKGHVLTSEMHLDQKFSTLNTSMIKVSSVLHSHLAYVLDLGSARKQQEWQNKILALIRSFIEQTKKGIYRKTLPKTLPAPEVKRRKVEEVEIGVDSLDNPAEEKSKSMSLRRSKAGRLLSKKRPHSDVRSLFPEQNSSAVKLQAYSVIQSDMSSQSLPQLHTETPPTKVQHLERITDEPDSGPNPPDSKPGGKRTMSGSTSMDSLLSLSDVDVAMDIPTSPKAQTSGGGASETDRSSVRQKPMRRAAIKVKRSKTFTGVGPGNSSSDIIKQRAREAREASRSPPPFLAAALDGSDSQSNSEVGSSLFGGSGYGNNNMTSDPMVHEEVALRLDLEATPTPDDLGDNKVEPDSIKPSFSPERSLVHSLSPVKRPRSSSHEQSRLEDELSVSVQIVDSEEEDGLELGESCGQSLLRGRVMMPVPLEENEGIRVESEQLDEAEGGSVHNVLEESSSSWVTSASFGGGGGTEDEDGFVIVEDSSDTEDDEEGDDSSEDLEKAGNDIVTSLLEVADMEEASYLHESSSSLGEGAMADQVVPQNDDVMNVQDISDHITQEPSLLKSTSPSKTPFQFKGSATNDRAIDIYGTLPNKKKKFKASSTSPLLSPSSDNQPSFVRGELSRSSIRRMDGFSRLLEFTRRQVEEDEDYQSATSSSLSELDVSQSLPVVSNFSLDDILEDKEPETRDTVERMCALGNKMQGFETDYLNEAPNGLGQTDRLDIGRSDVNSGSSEALMVSAESESQQELILCGDESSEKVMLALNGEDAVATDVGATRENGEEVIVQHLEVVPEEISHGEEERANIESPLISADDVVNAAEDEATPELIVAINPVVEGPVESEEVLQIEPCEVPGVSEACVDVDKTSDEVIPEVSDVVSISQDGSAAVEGTVEVSLVEDARSTAPLDGESGTNQDELPLVPEVAPTQEGTELHVGTDTMLSLEAQRNDEQLEDYLYDSKTGTEDSTINPESFNHEPTPSSHGETSQEEYLEEEATGRNSDRTPQDVQQVIPQLGFFTRWNRTLWYQVRTFLPSYRSSVLLGVVAVLAGLLYRAYFS